MRLCIHTLKQIILIFLTMLIDICRYFEGQISPILEETNEADVEHSPIRVTEAAEKVSGFSIYLCGLWIYLSAESASLFFMFTSIVVSLVYMLKWLLLDRSPCSRSK